MTTAFFFDMLYDFLKSDKTVGGKLLYIGFRKTNMSSLREELDGVR
jgi:hypothetical protein